MTTLRIAVIAGDGIGKEVMPEGLRAIESVLVAGPRTPGIGGTASTTDLGLAVAGTL